MATPGRRLFVPPRDPDAEPICLLTREWAARRREPVEVLLAEAAGETPRPDGMEYLFAAAPDLWPRIETFIAEEGECCPFAAFEAFETADALVLRIIHPSRGD